MTIDIHQKKFSIADKYRILLNGELKYIASRQPFQWLAEILVSDFSANTLKIKINKRFHLFKANYDIALHNVICYFNTVSYLKSHFQCRYDRDVYDIFGHRGRKYSIFKNDQQIAWWEKELITVMEGDQYRIIANDDSNAELLVAFCLIIDNYIDGNHGDSLVTINWGYFGLQTRHFDQDWRTNS